MIQMNTGAIELDFIAVDKKYQRQGIGKYIIDYIINKLSEFIYFFGCRYFLLYAINEQVKWYKKLGFDIFLVSENPQNQILMYMDFRDRLEIDRII